MRKPVKCALEGCVNEFSPKVHNQRFCSKECCRIYTNARILEQYHQKRKKVYEERSCKINGCGTVLSKYNTGNLCATHERQAFVQKLRKWGWTIDE